jgi:hypothetical protein
MELIGWCVIIPCSLAALLTGLVQSLATEWGLFRHYWVLAKFLLTIGATGVLLMHMPAVSRMSGVAAETTLFSADLGAPRIQLAVHAGGGLLVLLATTILSVFKPWGMTPYGRRQQDERRQASQPIPPHRLITARNRNDTCMADRPSHPDSNDDTGAGLNRGSTSNIPWRRYVLLGIIGLVLLVVVLHLHGGGLAVRH